MIWIRLLARPAFRGVLAVAAVLRRLRRSPIRALLAAIAIVLLLGLGCREIEEDEVPGRASLLTPEASPAVAASPTPSPSPTPSELPPPPQGYTWHLSPQLKRFELIDYAVHIPSDWVIVVECCPEWLGPEGTSFATDAWPLPSLAITQGPTAGSIEHPLLNVLPGAGGGCTGGVGAGSAIPSGQLVAGSHAWTLYDFSCDSGTGAHRGVAFTGQAGETTVGETIFAVVLYQPLGNTASDAHFRQALASFTSQ